MADFALITRRETHKTRALKLGALGFVASALFLFEQTLLASPAENQIAHPSHLTLVANGVSTNAPALDTAIHLSFTGPIGRARVVQQFFNGTGEWVEAKYVFPLPEGAAVDEFSIQVGNRRIVGAIQEREQAKSVYRKAKDQGQRASLVEQERPNLFTTSVANVGPGETLKVELGYWLVADYKGGSYRARLPLTFTPRYVPAQHSRISKTNSVQDAARLLSPVALVSPADSHRVNITVDLDAGMPVALVQSATHDISVSHSVTGYTVSLTEQSVPLDRDFEVQWAPASSSEAEASLWVEDHPEGLFGLLLLTPPTSESVPAPALAREVIFVVDTSGSMAGLSLAQAKESLQFALDRLAPSDHFNVIQFNSVTRRLFSQSVPVSAENLSDARIYIDRLSAEGGTEMAPALVAATENQLTEGVKQIVFVTDGSVGNEAGLAKLLESRLGNARLFSVGLGSAPNGWFMREIARVGRGTFTLIPTVEEVGGRMTELFEKLESPQVTDIIVDWSVDAQEYPRPIGDLYRGEPLMLTARLGSIPDLVTISGRTGGQHWVRQLMPSIPGSTGIAQTWGRRHIDSLLAQPGAEAPDIVGATETALKFGLLSPYTSLVAVEQTPSRPAGIPIPRHRIASLLPHGSDLLRFPATATSAPLQLLLGSLCLLFSIGLFVGAIWGVRRVRT